MKLWRRLWRTTFQRKVLLAEACLHVGAARLALGCLRYKTFEAMIAGNGRVGPNDETSVAARQIGSVVRRVASIVPWRSDCLIQAAAARWMLRRRDIVTHLYIGVTHPNTGFAAHAWLTSGPCSVTGGPGHNHFKTIRIL